MSLDQGAVQLRVACQCLEGDLAAALELLKLAKPYVGHSSTIGGQDLSGRITDFIADQERQGAEREHV